MKLKKKYKWTNKESHFLEIERERKMMEIMRKRITDSLVLLRVIENKTTGGILEFNYSYPCES